MALAADVCLPTVSDNERNRLYFLHWNNSAGEAGPALENWLSTKLCWGLWGRARDGNPVMQDFSSSTRAEGVWFSAYAKRSFVCFAGDDMVAHDLTSECCNYTTISDLQASNIYSRRFLAVCYLLNTWVSWHNNNDFYTHPPSLKTYWL